MLWTAFTVVALIIVVVFSLLQFFLLKDTYERELAKDVTEKGKHVETMLEVMPPNRNDEVSFNAFIRYLSTTNDVDIYVINLSGQVLFPTYVGFPESDFENDLQEDFIPRVDFSEEVQILLPK